MKCITAGRANHLAGQILMSVRDQFSGQHDYFYKGLDNEGALVVVIVNGANGRLTVRFDHSKENLEAYWTFLTGNRHLRNVQSASNGRR